MLINNLNITRLSLGSFMLMFLLACNGKTEVNQQKINKKIIKRDTCRLYKYEGHQIVSNLGCYSCHIRYDLGVKDKYGGITFADLSAMDSLKLYNYAFKKRHRRDYDGVFKASRMDTLNDCEIRNAIHYIKDFNRKIPMPSK